MFIKRSGEKNDCIVSGMAVDNMREKTYEDKKFYEIPVSMGKDAGIVSVTVWNRKPAEIKKYDHVLACGMLKVAKKTNDAGEEKTYYSLNADFVIKEALDIPKTSEKPQEDLQPIDDDDLPF